MTPKVTRFASNMHQGAQITRSGRFAAYDSAQASNLTPPPPAGGPPPLGRGGLGSANRLRESCAARLADVVIGHYEAPICRGEHCSSAEQSSIMEHADANSYNPTGYEFALACYYFVTPTRGRAMLAPTHRYAAIVAHDSQGD